jgi:hypothetical protein
MKTDYESIFRHRGESYNLAMKRYPSTRRKEFENLFLTNPLEGDEKIVDCPSLGGYLQENVSNAHDVTSLDFCFSSDRVTATPSNNWGLVNYADRVVCLAASHHINDIDELFNSAYSCLRMGGIMHLSDVDMRNPLRYFLDGFVGSWSSTGHNGIWRDFLDLAPYVESKFNLKATTVSDLECPWVFSSLAELMDFCRLLFGLDLDPSNEQIVSALEEYVGVEYYNSVIKVNWRLSYIDFLKY